MPTHRYRRRTGRGLLAGLGAAAILVLVSRAPARGGGEAEICRVARATVSVTWDAKRAPTASGVVARVSYPPQVEVRTSGEGSSAAGQVENLTGASGGLFDAIRKDVDRNGSGELLNVGLVTRGIRPGEFVRVEFDCRPGAGRPTASQFSCVAEVADETGPVEGRCAVRVDLS